MPKPLRAILLIALGLIIVAVGGIAGYANYLERFYTRVPDGITITNSGAEIPRATLTTGTTYSALTYNIGFGAYTADYTFFMDTGVMNDGTETCGEHAVGASEESVRTCVEGAIATSAKANDGKPADFMLFQEVDFASDRSYLLDQSAMIRDAFPEYSAYLSPNFHTGYLFYPFNEPIGSVKSGILTLSNRYSSTTKRRSFPIDESFPTKFFDLDRCYSVTRLPVSDGHELVLINTHMSAYDEGGKIRAKQLEMLTQTLAEEYARGNYVVAGGDWNHALCGSEKMYPSQQELPGWAVPLPEEELPEGFSVVRADNIEEVASCRSADIPFERGVDYIVTIDGFIVSDNVSAKALNIETNYEFSDHSPVLLTFTLGRQEL